MLVDIQSQIKVLVQQVVEAYLKEKLLEKKEQPITLLFAYQSSNPSLVMEAITPLLDVYDVTLILSREWIESSKDICGKSTFILEEMTNEELQTIVEKTSILVIPVATHRLLSKLALTIDDELAVWLAIQYQLLGKPIVIANNGVEPNVYEQIHAPHTVQERLQSYIRQVKKDQVKWIPLSKLAQTVDEQASALHEKQSLILEKHVEKAYRDGIKELVVPEKSKITPSAKDLAKELKIQITKTDA